MASASAEAETGALFHNGQEVAHMHQILKELEYEQPCPTRLTTNNSTADGFKCQQVHQIKLSALDKATDMRFYWIQDRVEQGELAVHWLHGEDNLSTKNHPPAHHIKKLR
jgi:hypothetical protein